MKFYVWCFISIVTLGYNYSAIAQEYVGLSGKQQYINVKGTGKPVVVFVNGLGTDLSNFKQIQKSISKTTTTISYDRAGTGKSQYIDVERSLPAMVQELNALLKMKQLKAPYVFVAHSMGGYIIRFYAALFPDSVAGMIFIDPSHEEFLAEKLKMRSPEEQIELDKRAHFVPADAPIGYKEEFRHFLSTDAELLKGISLPSTIPVTILTSSKVQNKGNNPYAAEDQSLWVKLHEKWAGDNIRHVVTNRSGHFIHWDEPQLVISEILNLIHLQNIDENCCLHVSTIENR